MANRLSPTIGIKVSCSNSQQLASEQFRFVLAFVDFLMCRVVLGNTETIPHGSEQWCPSSVDFDSGIDNPQNPRKYVIWGAYMNSHIYPNYIVSFKARPFLGLSGILNYANKHNRGSIRLSVLFDALSGFVNHSQIRLVSKCFDDFQEQKIDRSELVKMLRILLGDEMLVSAVKLCWEGRI